TTGWEYRFRARRYAASRDERLRDIAFDQTHGGLRYPKSALRLRAPSLRLEVHGDAVDAVAQMRRRRTVLEHVPQMAAAAAAMHLGADHAVAAVGRGFDRARDRIVEAR